MAFPGTFLVVSHDRYFLDKVSNCTLELDEGKMTEYNGNYTYYHMKKEIAEQEAAEERAEAGKAAAAKLQKTAKPLAAAETGRQQKKVQEQQNNIVRGAVQSMSEARRTELIQKTEAQIAMAEAELKGLEYAMNSPEIQSDPVKSAGIAEEYAAKEQEIEQRYAEWERLTDI